MTTGQTEVAAARAAAAAVLVAAGDNGGGGKGQGNEDQHGRGGDETEETSVDNEDVKAYVRNCRAYDVSSARARACE